MIKVETLARIFRMVGINVQRFVFGADRARFGSVIKDIENMLAAA